MFYVVSGWIYATTNFKMYHFLYISVKKKWLPTIFVKHVDCKMHPDFTVIKLRKTISECWWNMVNKNIKFLLEKYVQLRHIYGCQVG